MRQKVFGFLIGLQLIGMSLQLSAQVTVRNILQNKYALTQIQSALLEFNQYHPFPTTPEQWKASVPDSILNHVIKEAESELNFKFEPISASLALTYVRTGDRIEHSNISFAKRAVLLKFILAESIENKGRFTEYIINGLWSICEESFWGVPAHISNTGLPDVDKPYVELFSAETAALLGLTDYFMAEKLDKINPLLRKRIYSEVNKRIFIPMTNDSDGYGWMSKTKPVNNWNPWIISNWIMTTLLLEKDNTRRAQMVHHAMRGLDAYINSLGDEGGCDEGPSYWFAAGASTFDCLEMLNFATKGAVNIYQEPLIQKMGAYIYKTHIAGKYFVNFSDADPQVVPDGIMIYRFGKAIHDENMVNMGVWAFQQFNKEQYTQKLNRENFYKPRFVRNILTIKELPSVVKPYEQPNDIWVSDVQVMAARSSNGLYLASHAGHNAESHNHNDVGDFIVYANGQPVIIDAGRGNYTARTFSSHRYELWFTQSQNHNLPIINGFGQIAGREYTSNEVKYELNNKEASLMMNIEAAYDTLAGIKSWNRVVSLNRSKNQVELLDTYSLSKKQNIIQQVFMTPCKIDTSMQGNLMLTTPDGVQVSLQYDATVWTLSTSYPSVEGAEYSSLLSKWDKQKIIRILFTNTKANKKGSNLFTISK